MMSFKEFKASVSTSKVAGPQQQPTTSKHITTDIAKKSSTMASPTPSTSSTISSNQEPTNMKMGKLFGFIDDTYRDIRRIHSGLHKDVYNTHLMQTINKYKNGCNKIFEDVLESHDMSRKLAQNIVRTIDIFKELCTSLTDLEEYQHRVCELMAIFIACELRLSVDTTIQEQLLIGQRIVFIMRRHLVQEVEEETRYNILRTLVYLPRLFNARDIMCAIFGQFIPMKPVSDVNVLPDKLYMLYIIVFYRWMMMQKDDDDRLLIVNFAESFMKPSVTLCTNQLYATHLPRYTTHSTATRTILNNMKFYRDIRNASIIDNALKNIGSIVDLCDDEEDADLIILDAPKPTEFAEIFSAVQLEPLDVSMSNIKLEEETVVGIVDLTAEEDELTDSPSTVRDRHEKWLNNFQQLAKQFRESQLIMERQQNSQLISNNQNDEIICLDSDSENEEEELLAANANETQEIAKHTGKSSELVEDLFVDNYPPTVTPINCSTDLESFDDDDATKLSSRFLSGNIRTYPAKRIHQMQSQANVDTAYRRDSIHISSTPPERPDDEYSDNQDDEGTDVQDENDQEEDEAETFPSITLHKPRPRGPYPTYNNMLNNKVVFSQSITRLPYDKDERSQEPNEIQQFCNNSSEAKTPKKQKKKVHFNTSPVGPSVVPALGQNKPLKPALQQTKYKASDAPDYFHLRGFERFTNSAPSTTESNPHKQQEQQELTSENCNKNQNNESKKREVKRSFLKLNHNNNNKCLKNLSVFNQKYLFKQKSFKNVKINLKKLKLNNDISLTNSKSKISIEEQPPPPPLPTTLTLLNNDTTYLNYKQTETCQLKTKLIENNNADDDAIFKKPLPVTRKFVKSPKPIKINKVVSLRAHPFYFNATTSSASAEKDSHDGDEHILQIPLVTHLEKLDEEIKTDIIKPPPLTVNFESKVDASEEVKSISKEAEMDDLSKISKFLTEEINSLTSGHKDTTNIETTNVEMDVKEEGINEKSQNEELDKMFQTEATHEVETEVDNNASSEKSLINLESKTNEKSDLVMGKSLNDNDTNLNNLGGTSSISNTEQEPVEKITNQNPEKEIKVSENQNDKSKDEKEKLLVEDYQQDIIENIENISEESKTTLENQSIEVLNKDTLTNNKDVCDISETNSNSSTAKDGKPLELNDDSITTPSNENIDSTSDLNTTQDTNCNTSQEVDTSNPENKAVSSSSLVTQFCAEFLAGLPNEPSSALRNVSNTESDTSRNDIDFEFENNCTTPTMCRFDLDSMSENTSDIPTTSEACEADKLLEDFNHKTEDIVDSALSKKSHAIESIITHNDTLFSTNSHQTLKRSRDNEDNLDKRDDERTPKKFITELLNKESSQERNKSKECGDILIEKTSEVSTGTKTQQIDSKEMVNVADCKQSDEIINKNSKSDNPIMAHIKLEDSQPEVSSTQEDVFGDVNNESLHKEELKTQKSLKSHKKSKHNQENYDETPLKKLKKSNKQQTNVEAKIQSPVRKTSEDCKKCEDGTESISCCNTEKLENNTISDKETSINESEHMTVELGNWKQDLENEHKPSNSESGGVSAIFSFPKIPIISISICTTPNNKTYFKISKRGNDDTQSKDVGKMKQQEIHANESKNGDTPSVKTISEDLSCKYKNISILDSDEMKNANKLTEDEQATENNVEDEDEDYEEEEEEEETETDNMEIEKFSHDSNSACSLPLKKRPTQSEPNDETEDGESTDEVNSEQPEEIAAEVVIENFDKGKQILEHNSAEIEQILLENKEEHNREDTESSLKNVGPEVSNIDDNAFMINDFDENKPSTSAACFKKLNDPSSPFNRRVNNCIRPIGQPPVQIVTPQLKGNSPSPSQECRSADTQVSNAARMLTNTPSLPESYPATPMLSVANVEKLMDLNRFIEDLLASPDVMTIIDNANACGYYAEGQAYEMERIAILEHYNIANAKGNTSVTKPLYWRKSAGDTISIFNDNDNEWIALPPSTAKQLLKLSFVLSILQQQYKVSDVRQRINIALTFLIQTSCTSKFKSNTSNSSLQQRVQVYSRTISDNNSNNHNIPQPLPSTSYFRIATNNEALNTNFNISSSIDAAQDLQTNNYSNAQHQQTDGVSMQQEQPNSSNSSNQTWNNIMQFGNTSCGHGTDQMASSNNIENEQQQQQVQQDKRNSTWDELNNDQLYINPPCATSPQNEVIVNTNGVQLHEMPQNYQDQQNIFISITDESSPTVSGNSDFTHKYNTRQQQQQQHQQRTLDELEQISPSSTSPATQAYSKRQYLGNSNGAASLIQNSLTSNNNNRNNIITMFGGQEINLQNPYRMQQNLQQQHQQQQHQNPQLQPTTNKLLNITSPSTSFQQGNMSSQNLSLNINNNVRALNPLTQQQSQQQQRMSTRYTSTFNSQQQQQQTAIQLQNSQEHLAAAPDLFRNILGCSSYPAPFSPSSSSVSSRSLSSPATPATPTKTRKKTRVSKTQKTSIRKRTPTTMGALEDNKKNDGDLNNDGEYSIIRTRENLIDAYNSSRLVDRTSSTGKDDGRFRESSDDYYGATSDTDIIKNDAKLRTRCTVVIKPTKELLQYEQRKQDEYYNEILQEQRRKLELRALEKQREKERRQLSRQEEKIDTVVDVLNEEAEKGLSSSRTHKRNSTRSSPRNYNDSCMSSESEFETNFQLRTRNQKQRHVKEPLQTLSSLQNEIDSCLDKPTKEVQDQKTEEPSQCVEVKNNEPQTGNNINEKEEQQLCDINSDTGQTKMRELNLLADIAQHLSPYQLDLPECNNPPQSSPTPSLSPTKPIEPAINALEKTVENKDAESKGKVIVTEQLIIRSYDNLLEKSQQMDKNDNLQQQQSQLDPQENIQQEEIHDYAHEPKLNVAAIFNSSPASLLQDQNQQKNNTPVLDADVNTSNNKINNSLEQILEESIKSVTSPFNPNNESNASKTPQPQTQNETKIPLLISNVESLNHIQHDTLTGGISAKSNLDSDGAKNCDQNLNQRKSNQFSSENIFFMNKPTNEETKDVTEENTSDNATSRLLSTVESAIICGDLSNMSSEMEMTNNSHATALMPADLSDISLESELSKHLPEIAEPSPVVTDMSDNSNESDLSKSFTINNTHHTTTASMESNDIPVMSLPDLSLVMPPIPPPPLLPTSQQISLSMSSSTPQLENDYNPLDTSLNTPIKQPSPPTGEMCSSQSRGDLVTPLKFSLQTELESDNSPLKSTLEPENDNNVTKFLDLILNKTVTDAESETRDKIIKELNALTADTSATESVENIQKADIETDSKNPNSDTIEEEPDSKNRNSDIIEEEDADTDKNKNKVQNHAEEIKFSDASKLSKDEKVSKEKSKEVSAKNDSKNSDAETSETIQKQFVEPVYCNESIKHNTETSSKKEILIPEGPEIFPPKVNSPKESTTSINTEQISTTTPNSETSNAKLKVSPVKQSFNIKCRVRLKRLSITKHCKSTKKETWMAIPITKPEESETVSNDLINCDNSKNDATTLLKRPCLKYSNSKRGQEVLERKFSESSVDVTEQTTAKKPKLDVVEQKSLEAIHTQTPSQQETTNLLTPNTSNPGVVFNNNNNVSLSTKVKAKNSKTVTFDLSNLNDEFKDATCNQKQQKSKGHTSTPTAAGLGYYQKNTRHPRKLPVNTLRAAETLQIFVNTINDSARTPPPAEFNKKRSPIKNKCIAEDETPRPPLASTLLDTPACKKVNPEKSRTQITSSKLKDQLVSSLATPSISNITGDITTARIYTSSPLDQTLPEYDVDNVDTVADSELILPTTTGSLRRKLKRPKKSLVRPEPVDDISTDDISNQPECNGDDDTDAVVDNEDDVFAEELLPIPSANEHILEEIVSGRPTHIGTGTVIRDDYMNIEATATVPVYLFNDESRDLATPEPIQSSDANVVDSSSYLNTPSTANAVNNASTTDSTIGNLEKSMLSPSEHEVSSTQETFYQTPTKSKQIDAFGEKSMANKDKSSGSSNASHNQNKNDDKTFQDKEDHPTSYSSGLLQNNQVDTTNHSPEMCSLTLGSTTTTTTAITSNRKMRKASTHDEILFNELQQQQQQVQLQEQQQQNQQKSLQQNKRKTMVCAESTSDNGNIVKNKVVTSNLDDMKTNGSLGRIEDKFKILLKDGSSKRDKSELCNEGSSSLCGGNMNIGEGGGGGSSPSTTTTIVEEKPSKSKRKKLKSSKSEKNKHSERSTKIVLKASKLAVHVPDNPLKITIPKSRLIRPPPTPTPPTPNEDLDDRDSNSFYNNDDKIIKDKDKSQALAVNNHCSTKTETVDNGKLRLQSELIDTKTIVVDSEKGKVVLNAIASIVTNDKETLNTKRKSKTSHSTDNINATTPTNPTHNSNSTSPSTTNCSNKNNSNNSIFVKDKYDLIKTKDKHHHHLQENKEKSKDKLNSEMKKHDNHAKSGSTTNTNRHHKTSAKEKIRKKDKEKHKSLDKNFTAQVNVLKSITQKTTSSNLNTTPSSLTFSPSSNTATSSGNKQNNSSSKSSKNKLQDIVNGSTSATTQVLKSKTNLSSSQTALTSSTAGLTTQINTSSAASMSPSSVTISTNHVRKKLKTK